MKKVVAILLALVPAASAKPAPKPPEPTGPPSKAVTNEILDAISEEMNRAVTELQIPGTNAPKPYHISYKIT